MSSTQFLFDRQVAVTIGLPGLFGAQYTSLRTVFEVNKTSDATSHKAKIQLYNLNSKSRLDVQQKGLQIRLDAGYQGLTDTIFNGDVLRALHHRQGSDIVTTFETGDFEKEITLAHFEKSYPAGTKYVDIISDMAAALGAPIGTVIGIPAVTFNSGVTFSCTVRDGLERLLDKTGLEWHVTNGQLNILPITAHLGDEAIVLSQSTGLIGVPTLKDSGYEFNALLNPKIIPGCLLQVESETINGYFKARTALFKGDTHGNNWDVKVEAVEIAAKQTLVANQGTTLRTSP